MRVSQSAAALLPIREDGSQATAREPFASLLILPHLDIGRDRRTLTVNPGMNVADMVALAFPGVIDLSRLRVVIGDQIISQQVWHNVRPRKGATVIIRAVPGSDNLRSVLSVAVLVAAVSLGQYYAPTIAGALGVTSAIGTGIVASTATTAFPVCGSKLVDSLEKKP